MGLFSRRKSSMVSFSSPGEHDSFPPTQPYPDKTPQLHPVPGDQGFDFNFSNDLFSTSPSTTVPFNDGNARTNNTPTNPPSFATTRRPSRRLQKRPGTASTRPMTAQSTMTTSSRPRLAPSTKKNDRPPSASSRVFVVNGQALNSKGKVLPRTRAATEPATQIAPHSLPTLDPSTSTRSLKVKSLDLLKANPRLSYLSPPAEHVATGKSPDHGVEWQFRHDGRGLFAKKTVANLADELDSKALRKLLERDARRYQSTADLKDRYYVDESRIPGPIPPTRGTMRTLEDDPFENFGGYARESAYNPYEDPGPSTVRTVSPADQTDSWGSFAQTFPGSYPEESDTVESTARERPNTHLQPILLTGKSPSIEQVPETKKDSESPIILLAPNSARSTETQSTQPRSPPRESPIKLISPQTSQYPQQRPHDFHKDPTGLRPDLFSYPTGTSSYATAEEYQSLTPPERWPESPTQEERMFAVERAERWRGERSSDTESTASEYPHDEEDARTPIFDPHWRDSPAGTPVSRGSPVESEGEWLAGRMDIERAVRKSFGKQGGQGPAANMFESAPLPAVGRPDYEGAEWESSGDEGRERGERVRQGSAARKVEVRDSPIVLEGVVPRVSGGSRVSETGFEDYDEILLY